MDTITDIPNHETWTRVEPVLKGWSSDKKYYIEDREGRKLLLRLSDLRAYEKKQIEYDFIQLMNQLEFPMSRVLDLGVCNSGDNTYMLLTWVEGRPLTDCILSFSAEEQYTLGIEAGRILKLMHSIPYRGNKLTHWESALQAKILSRLKTYEECSHHVQGDQAAIAYVRDNIGLLEQLEIVYRHGDFHIGNLIYTDTGQIGVIDFNRCDSGDYVEEFYKLQSFDRELSTPFAKGKIDGYFAGSPPEDFWKRQALYVAYSSLYSIVWAIPFGTSEIMGMIARCKAAFEDYDAFKRLIPRWYAEGL